jgi:hypothetical protein
MLARQQKNIKEPLYFHVDNKKTFFDIQHLSTINVNEVSNTVGVEF